MFAGVLKISQDDLNLFKKTQGSTQKKTESDAIIRIPSQSKQPDPDVECDNELLDGFQHFLVSKLRN